MGFELVIKGNILQADKTAFCISIFQSKKFKKSVGNMVNGYSITCDDND